MNLRNLKKDNLFIAIKGKIMMAINLFLWLLKKVQAMS